MSEQEPHIFDRIFKRLMHLSGPAVISFINGVFGVDYPLDSRVGYEATEHIDKRMKRSTSDIILSINGERYLIECQRRDDKEMALRIFIYGSFNAFDHQWFDENDEPWIDFPAAAVIYLENTGKKEERLHIRFPDKTVHEFVAPALNFLEYSVAELEQRKMVLLLPFCLLKFYDRVKAGGDRKKLLPEMKALVHDIAETTGRYAEAGILTNKDVAEIAELLDRLYKNLYEQYNDLQEVKSMVEEVLELRVDKIFQKYDEMALRVNEITQRADKASRERDEIAQQTQQFAQRERSLIELLSKHGVPQTEITAAIGR